MQQPDPTTWCATRCVQLAITEAAFALDAVSAQAAMTTGMVGDRVLTRPIPPAPAITPASPVRTYQGPVSVGALALPVRSELALAPWSSTASELSVRPLTRRPPAWRSASYWRVVHTLLDDLVLKLESVAFLTSKVGHDAVPQLIATLAA